MDQIPSQPITITELQPHKNFFVRHILAEVFSLAVVIAVGVGGYYYQNSKQADTFVAPVHHVTKPVDPTADWQTYIARQYGFEIKFPETAKIVQQQTSVEVQYDKSADGYELPRLSLANIPDGRPNLKLTETKTFSSSTTDSNGENYIHFSDHNLDFFANCINSQNDPKVLDFCNQVLSTFKFDDTVFCGGIAGFPCPTTGYTCVSNGDYPDAGTTCTYKNPNTNPGGNKIEPPPPVSDCIQVITTAKNLKTQEVKDFPSPCDVPQGWEIIGGRPTQ